MLHDPVFPPRAGAGAGAGALPKTDETYLDAVERYASPMLLYVLPWLFAAWACGPREVEGRGDAEARRRERRGGRGDARGGGEIAGARDARGDQRRSRTDVNGCGRGRVLGAAAAVREDTPDVRAGAGGGAAGAGAAAFAGGGGAGRTGSWKSSSFEWYLRNGLDERETVFDGF